MSASPTTTRARKTAAAESAGTLKKVAVGALFAFVLLVPKLLRLRRDPRAWLVFRLALGVLGAALVLLPLSLWHAWLPSLAGLAMFLTAVLLPPPRLDRSLDDKARELGALVVVNGGDYQPGNDLPAAVQLFVGAERIWALDAGLRPLLVIPAAEIRAVRVNPGENWAALHIEWQEQFAEFVYRGFFAAHLAEVAASTIRGLRRSLLHVLQQPPEKPQSRAAGA